MRTLLPKADRKKFIKIKNRRRKYENISGRGEKPTVENEVKNGKAIKQDASCETKYMAASHGEHLKIMSFNLRSPSCKICSFDFGHFLN